MEPSPKQCAVELLETVPLLMRIIRANVRSHRGPELSVPQFRTMAFIGRNKGAALSDVAAHLGLTLPSASKLVEGLVSSKLATRKGHSGDRRCVVLGLTAAGQKRYAAARSLARNFIALRLSPLGREERARILAVTQTLKSVFSDAETQKTVNARTTRNGTKQLRRSNKKAKHG